MVLDETEVLVESTFGPAEEAAGLVSSRWPNLKNCIEPAGQVPTAEVVRANEITDGEEGRGENRDTQSPDVTEPLV